MLVTKHWHLAYFNITGPEYISMGIFTKYEQQSVNTTIYIIDNSKSQIQTGNYLSVPEPNLSSAYNMQNKISYAGNSKWCSSCNKTNFAKCTSQITSLNVRDCVMHFQKEVCKFHAQGQIVLFVHIFQHLPHSTVVSCSDYGHQRKYLVGCDIVMSQKIVS